MRIHHPHPLLLGLLIAAGAAGGVVEPASAQQRGAVRVTVRAADTGQPLAGAHVVVQGLGRGGTTDARGTLTLDDLPSGSQALEARYLGYRSQTARVLLEPGKPSSVTFALGVEPIALAPVRVRARRSILATNGFMERRGSGFGDFVTRAEIQEMQPRYLSDVLRRLGGIHLTNTAFGGTARASMRGFKVLGSCPIQYYVDGTMTTGFNIDEILPNDVEGMEVYRGASTIPPAFNKGTAMCGVIVIWTRVQ